MHSEKEPGDALSAGIQTLFSPEVSELLICWSRLHPARRGDALCILRALADRKDP